MTYISTFVRISRQGLLLTSYSKWTENVFMNSDVCPNYLLSHPKGVVALHGKRRELDQFPQK